MALNSILDTALTGLQASQTAIRTTSNNVANVNTPGFRRLEVQTEANITGTQANGVKVSGIERVVDEFLEKAARTASSNRYEFTAQREIHDQLQGFLGKPDGQSSLSSRIDRVFGAMADLSLSPTDTIRRQQTVTNLQGFLGDVDRLQDSVQQLRGEASERMVDSVDQINGLLREIHDLNPLLAEASTSLDGQGSVENQMARALSDLSEFIDINSSRQAGGTFRVTTGSGMVLVDQTLRQLEYNAPGISNAETIFPNVEMFEVNPDTLAKEDPAGTDLAPHIRSGRLKGLLDVRDEQLVDLSEALGEMGARVKDEFNAIHNDFNTVPPPNSLTGKQTAIQGNHDLNFSGAMTLNVLDGSNQITDQVTVDFDAGTVNGTAIPNGANASFNDLIATVNGAAGFNGAATLSLTNGVMSLTAANANDGVVIDDVDGNESSRAGRGFSHFFGMNDLITSDSDGIFEPGLSGTDDLGTSGGDINLRVAGENNRELTQVAITLGAGSTVNDLVSALNSPANGLNNFFTFSLDGNTGKISYEPVAGRENVRLQTVTDTTDMGGTGQRVSETFGLDTAFRATAARDLRVLDRIQDSPDQLSLAKFDDTGGVGATGLTSGDQRGALAFQRAETSLVQFAEAGELRQTNVTMSQYVGNFLGNAGLMGARAENLEEDNQALQLELEERNADVSGVNMDEELANLVTYQNSYNAAARVLSSVQELFDSLLSAV
ncbi:flagellar hook-associated protein FlgK [Yunchengibacter salinarum]|uniref:flagellar hook-associated protein FlgK n=1 Tax=Yunchengibacter salinarum TaxID=3133399 RepID=UPI0035B5DF7E